MFTVAGVSGAYIGYRQVANKREESLAAAQKLRENQQKELKRINEKIRLKNEAERAAKAAAANEALGAASSSSGSSASSTSGA